MKQVNITAFSTYFFRSAFFIVQLFLLVQATPLSRGQERIDNNAATIGPNDVGSHDFEAAFKAQNTQLLEAPEGCTITVNGSLTTADPTQTPRLFRDGIPDACPGPGPGPGCAPTGSGNFHYDSYMFTNNTASTQCVTVFVDAMTCVGTQFIYAGVYSGSFNPTNICTNYIASSGSSPNPSISFSFTIDAAETFVLVISETTANAGCPGYSAEVTGAVCPVSCPTVFGENFDSVTPPALPAGWTAVNASGPNPMWGTSNSGNPAPPADTSPNAAFVDDPDVISDKRLTSPSIPIMTSTAQLSFRQNFDLEQNNLTDAFDAGVLEVSIGGGPFNDIIAAGGSFVTGGYNHTSISGCCGNPLLPSRPNWSGNSGGFITTTVNLPPSAAGQNIQLRWRMGSDNSRSQQGWRVDTVSIAECPPTRALSRKTHGGAGVFDLNLPLTGTAGIECRSGGGATNDFTMVVTFAGAVTVSGSPQAQVISGLGTIGSGGVSNGGMVSVSGNMVTIPLTNVADQQTIQVRLNGVNNAFAADDTPETDVVIPMSRLLGDSNGNGAVNAGDVGQTKSRIGQALSTANFRSDFNESGGINAGDVAIVKSNTGHALP